MHNFIMVPLGYSDLKVLLQRYVENPGYVFKRCGPYIVVLEKLRYTRTNEFRQHTDSRWAKFRGNMFNVAYIVNTNNGVPYAKAKSDYDPSFIYKTGQVDFLDEGVRITVNGMVQYGYTEFHTNGVPKHFESSTSKYHIWWNRDGKVISTSE